MGHVLRVNLAFVTVVVMVVVVDHSVGMVVAVVVAMVVMVIVTMVVMVIVTMVVMVIVTMVVMVIVTMVIDRGRGGGRGAAHLQHDKVECFDARGLNSRTCSLFKARWKSWCPRQASLSMVSSKVRRSWPSWWSCRRVRPRHGEARRPGCG